MERHEGGSVLYYTFTFEGQIWGMITKFASLGEGDFSQFNNHHFEE